MAKIPIIMLAVLGLERVSKLLVYQGHISFRGKENDTTPEFKGVHLT